MKLLLSILLLLSYTSIYAQDERMHTKKIELELSLSDAINASVNFKFGKSQIYGIVSAGILRFDNPKNSVIGLGLGHQQFHKKGWSNEIELMAYTMNRNGNFSGDLSMLSQARFTIGKQISSRFKAFCGPTINYTILKDKNSDGNFSNDIAPYSIWSNKKNKVKMDAWIGISGGIRF